MTGDEAMLLMERIRADHNTVLSKKSNINGQQTLLVRIDGDEHYFHSPEQYEFFMRGKRHQRPVFGQEMPGIEHRTRARDGHDSGMMGVPMGRKSKGNPDKRYTLEQLGTAGLHKLAAAYRDGASATGLATQLGVTPSSLLRYLRRHGVATRPIKKLPTDVLGREILRDLFKDGRSAADLARAYDVCPQTMRDWLRREVGPTAMKKRRGRTGSTAGVDARVVRCPHCNGTGLVRTA